MDKLLATNQLANQLLGVAIINDDPALTFVAPPCEIRNGAALAMDNLAAGRCRGGVDHSGVPVCVYLASGANGLWHDDRSTTPFELEGANAAAHVEFIDWRAINKDDLADVLVHVSLHLGRYAACD